MNKKLQSFNLSIEIHIVEIYLFSELNKTMAKVLIGTNSQRHLCFESCICRLMLCWAFRRVSRKVFNSMSSIKYETCGHFMRQIHIQCKYNVVRFCANRRFHHLNKHFLKIHHLARLFRPNSQILFFINILNKINYSP